MIHYRIRGIAIAAGVTAVSLALAMPASADTIWGDNHIGNQAGAPTGVGATFGYTPPTSPAKARRPAPCTGPPTATSKS